MQVLPSFSVGLHLLWAVGFVWVLWFVPYGEQILPRPEWFGRCDGCGDSSDAIFIASQMGRLDVVSIALAILGVVIAAAALGSYVVIRDAAMNAAREEANDWIRENHTELIPGVVEKLVMDQRLISTLATEIRKHISRDESGVTKKEADEFAQSMGDP